LAVAAHDSEASGFSNSFGEAGFRPALAGNGGVIPRAQPEGVSVKITPRSSSWVST
jgi:hypothetical protein